VEAGDAAAAAEVDSDGVTDDVAAIAGGGDNDVRAATRNECCTSRQYQS